jgi:diazepam-binding inhibitor (GABA receptor modulating acyl-CoA-binding protein)
MDDNYPLAKHFDEVKDKIRVHGKSANNDDLQMLYGLYKQATEGDNTTDEPSFYQFTAKAKWNAWTKHKGKPKAQAQHEYVEFALKFFPDEEKANYQS